MYQRSPSPAETVSNLVPIWDDEVALEDDGGGSWEPEAAIGTVERAVETAIRVEQVSPELALPSRARMVSPPERFDPTERVERPSTYSMLDADDGDVEAEADDDLPRVDYDLLHRREIAKELLRARLIRIAEQREHRSAYEIVFIMLAAAVAVLLAAPPLVQVLQAAHGISG